MAADFTRLRLRNGLGKLVKCFLNFALHGKLHNRGQTYVQRDTYACIIRAYLFELKPQEKIKRLSVDIGYLDRLVHFTIHNLKNRFARIAYCRKHNDRARVPQVGTDRAETCALSLLGS